MEIHRSKSLQLPKSVVAIGAFDGVHRGHQMVLQELVSTSRMEGKPSVVYTFDPPPKSYFKGVPVLTNSEEKLSLIERLGIDYLVLVNFNKQYLQRSKEEFLTELAHLNPVKLIVGEDFRFWHNRTGDVSLLRKHFQVKLIQSICCKNGEKISSTRIRNLIQKGQKEQALPLLGWGKKQKKANTIYT